jgi:predicted phage gp36 major capsid-like protein
MPARRACPSRPAPRVVRHLTLVILHQYEAAQLWPEMAADAAGQRRYFRQAYTIVDRLGISTLRDPFTAKPFVLFYTRRRVGGDVVNFEAYKLLLIGV